MSARAQRIERDLAEFFDHADPGDVWATIEAVAAFVEQKSDDAARDGEGELKDAYEVLAERLYDAGDDFRSETEDL